MGGVFCGLFVCLSEGELLLVSWITAAFGGELRGEKTDWLMTGLDRTERNWATTPGRVDSLMND